MTNRFILDSLDGIRILPAELAEFEEADCPDETADNDSDRNQKTDRADAPRG